MESPHAEKGSDGEDMFDAIKEAYGETEVIITLYPQPRSDNDFDYPYQIVTFHPGGEAALVAKDANRCAGVEYMKVEVAGDDLEAYGIDPDMGRTYLGNVMQVREPR